MKHAKLGLKQRKGVNYSVAPDGRLFRTENGETTTLKKLKLPESKEFLYFIDSDGDLAREWRTPPTKSPIEEPRSHPTQPASAKLDARALYQRIDGLLFPVTQMCLAHSGFVEDGIDRSRKAYEKELVRLAAEISRALGPGIEVDVDEYDSPGFVWWLRGRAVLLWLGWEDKEFPGDIRLEVADDDIVQRALAAAKKPTKKKR